MTKNEIIEKVIAGLMEQRKELSYELININHNEASYMERRTTLEVGINNIDMQIDRRIMDCEIQLPTKK